MKSWNILQSLDKWDKDEILDLLLKNRNISENQTEEFLNPKVDYYNLKNIGIEKVQLTKFIQRLRRAINKNERIIIFGDYDVDGICASAIFWETFFTKTKNVMPYIPDRVEEGYGLSVKGLENVIKKFPDTKLIVTVDNGIVAFDAVEMANKIGIDVVITDHHVKGKTLPNAFCIIHTTSICGAGIAWFVAKELGFEEGKKIEEKLGLTCLATVADLMPLTGPNRAIVREGLKILKRTKRVGLTELFKEAGLDKTLIDVYSIGHIIAPRLNASGRIENAMNSLRLICTKNEEKARDLAGLLGAINTERKELTQQSFEHAKLLMAMTTQNKVAVVAHKSYNQGVIGLVASRLVDNFHKPSFAISVGEEISKGSARSIKGVNIIELLRSVSKTLVEAGGHPMAAGFSVRTSQIEEFILALSKKADELIDDKLLAKTLTIDAQIPLNFVGYDLYEIIQKLLPFGMANPEPIFSTKNVNVLEVRKIGREQNHLKMKLERDGKVFDAIAFQMAEKVDVGLGDIIDVAYTVDENEWNGKKSLQLKLMDLLTKVA